MMKLLLVLLVTFWQSWEETPKVSFLKDIVQNITLAQNEGRAPGSEGEAQAALVLEESFKRSGLDLLSSQGGELFGIKDGNDTLTSRDVIGFLEGYDPQLKGRYIVVGAHIDNIGSDYYTVDDRRVQRIFSGANSNASGVAMLASLAERAVRNSYLYKRSIIFVGFGSGTKSFAGSWYFLNRFFGKDADKIDAFINLDCLGGGPEGMQVFCCGNSDLESLVREMSLTPQSVKPEMATMEAYPSDHHVFYAAKIPSVVFSTGRFSAHNTEKDTESALDYDLMEREDEYLNDFLLRLANKPEGFPSFDEVVSVSENKIKEGIFSWSECDVPPTFSNNPDPSAFLHKWVYTYLKYPQDCINEGVQGKVMVEFVIEKDGKVTNVRAVRGPDDRLMEEAVKVVAASPNWKAGKVNGRKVRSSMTIPVEFRLQMKGKQKKRR